MKPIEVPNGYMFKLPRGTQEYVLAVRCGVCGAQVAFYAPGPRHSPMIAAAKLRDMGWRWRGKHGYVCEACTAEDSRRKDDDLEDWDWEGADHE